MKEEEIKNKKTTTKGKVSKTNDTKKKTATKSSTAKTKNSTTKSNTIAKKETKPKTDEVKNKKSNVESKTIGNKKNDENISVNKKDKSTTNEILRMVIVGAVLLVLIGITFIIGITHNVNKARYQKHTGINEISVSEYMKIIAEEDTSIIYIARPTCSYCQMFEPILTSVLEKYKIGVEYVDISAITTQEEWDIFYNSNEFLASGEWGTPTLLIYKNKEIIDINPGYVEEETLINFLKTNELIGD